MNTQDIPINILLKEESGVSIARCPQLGIVATGSSRAQALNKIERLIGLQVDYAQRNNRIGEILCANQTVAWLLSRNADDGYAVVR